MYIPLSMITIIPCLVLLLLSTTVLAVPSCTTFSDHSLRNSDLLASHDFSTTISTNPSIWSRASSRAIDWVWKYRDKEEHAQISLSKAVPERPSRQLLAQYGDQLVLRFNTTTQSELSSLAEATETLFLDIWNTAGNHVDIRVAKDVLPSLLGLLPASLQQAHKPLMQGHELAQAVLHTYPVAQANSHDRVSSRRALAPATITDAADPNIFFADYQSLGVIDHWMRLLESLFPSHVRLVEAGTSYEKRPMQALRVGVHPQHSGETANRRKTVIVSGGTHAREWISTSTVNYVAYSFITMYGKDSSITKLLEELDFVFVPTINPDGYAYSFDTDRLWRKNRQPTALSFCPGVDLDRSWNFHWDGQRTIDNPCSESFAGENPFEGHEAQAFAAWAKNEKENNNVEFVGFLDLHSYSQEILYPYAYTCGEKPPTLEDLQEMGYGLARAIHFSSRQNYKVMSACEGNVAANGMVLPKLEGGGGSALDWFYHEMNVKKAFQIKLRDNGAYGFLLPKEHIVPTGAEILTAVEWFGKELARTTENFPGTAVDESIEIAEYPSGDL